MKQSSESSPASILLAIVSGAVVLATMIYSITFRLWEKQPVPPVYVTEEADQPVRPYKEFLRDHPEQQYPAAVQARLDGTADNDVAALHCSESFVVGDDGYYFTDKGTLDLNRHVSDPDTVALIDQIPKEGPDGRVLLGGTICHLDSGAVAIYTEGYPEESRATGKDAITSVRMMGQEEKGPIDVVQETVWPFPGCGSPLLVTHSGHVFLSCSQVSQQESTTRYLDVDTQGETMTSLATCHHDFAGSGTRCE